MQKGCTRWQFRSEGILENRMKVHEGKCRPYILATTIDLSVSYELKPNVSPVHTKIFAILILTKQNGLRRNELAKLERRRKLSTLCKNVLFIGTWGPIFGSGGPSVTKTPCADLTDVTLADEDTNSVPTDNANGKRAIQGNMAMHVSQPCG